MKPDSFFVITGGVRQSVNLAKEKTADARQEGRKCGVREERKRITLDNKGQQEKDPLEKDFSYLSSARRLNSNNISVV